jgi:hypothetical protein
MKLFDLFRRKIKPNNVGKNSVDPNTEYVNKYYLLFPELDGEPTYELQDKLTIGSEIGDVLLEDDSVSARHCTLFLNQDVISILDHNSTTGTYIGKKAIDPGKMFILSEKDKLKLGDLVLDVQIQQEAVEVEPMPEAGPELSDDDATGDIDVPAELEEDLGDMSLSDDTASMNLELEDEDFSLEEEEEPAEEEPVEEILTEEEEAELEVDVEQIAEELENRPKAGPGIKLKKAKIKLDFKKGAEYPIATSALLRVLSLICDVLIVLIIYSLLEPFDTFRIFLQDLPEKIWVHARPIYEAELKGPLEQILKDVPGISEMIKDASNYWKSDYSIVLNLFILFASLRLVTTLLFGVSIGQFLLGVRGYGNAIVIRLLGFIREIVGLITGPLLVFDLPTVFNVRSVKEVLTFTRVHTPSTLKSWMQCLVFIPLLLVLYFVSPMFQGLEIREEIMVKATTIRPIKEIPVDEKFMKSNYMEMALKLPMEYRVYPTFQFEKKGKKVMFNPVLNFYDYSVEKSYELSKKKSFDWKKLLKIAFSLNIFSKSNYPELSSFLYDISSSSKNFKSQGYNRVGIAAEMQNLVITSLELGINRLPDHVMTHGPLLKGFVDFRDSLLAMLGSKVKGVEIRKMGNTYFAFFELDVPRKREYAIIPLVPHEGIIYSLSSNNRGLNSKKISKIFVESLWLTTVDDSKENKINYLRLIDKLASDKSELKIAAYIQSMYEKMFKDIKNTILEKEEGATKLWELSVSSLIKVLDETKLKTERKNKRRLKVWQKFYRNLSDLLKALKENDHSYFGIKKKKAV